MQRQSVRNLPANKNPTGTRCIQITIPDDDDWERDLYSEIYRLGLWMLWERDVAKSGKPVAARWRQAIATWAHCTPSGNSSGGGAEAEDNLIRQNPDNPCLLETSIDGTNWCVFADLSKCMPAPNQPGPGSEQPAPGGGCVTYHGVMGAAGPWYVPTVLNTGDTIEFSGATGVTNDGGNIAWRCADGGLFFAGANTGVTTTVSSDPLPAVPHLKIIGNIDGTFYDVYPGPFTVPSGVTNGQMTLQVNDDPIVGDAGTLTFDLKVCNQQEGNWTSVLDFTVSPYASFVTPAFAPWTVGIGFEGAANGSIPHWCQIDIALPSFSLDSLVAEVHCDSVGGTTQVVFYQVNATGYGTPGTPIAGGTQIYGVTQAAAGVTAITLVVSSGSSGGPDKITKLILAGHGPKPSMLP